MQAPQFGRFRAFIDLTRIHGTPIIIGFCLIGMFSAAGTPSPLDVVLVIAVGFLFKSAGSIHNELVDFDIDSMDPVLRKKPIQSGLITKLEARAFMAGCLLAGGALSLAFFPLAVSGLLFLALGIIFLYNAWGKFVPVLYETLFAASMTILLLSGAVLAGGLTRLTLALGLSVFTSNIFAQWLNGCRDVEGDRLAGVGSLASLSSPRDGRKDVPIISGAVLWALYTFSLLLPFGVGALGLEFLPPVLGIQLLTSLQLFRELPRAASRGAFNRLLVFQVVAYWFMIPIFLAESSGWSVSLGLTAFVILGTALAIACERATQYKLAFTNKRTERGSRAIEGVS